MGKKFLLFIPFLLVILYLLGPAPKTPVYKKNLPTLPSANSDLEKYISSHEAMHKVKPDNEARIVWANDSLKQKTKYAIVYLHGFSASQAEGAPTHEEIAKEFGCNLYLSRLAEHGIDTVDAMINLTADKLWESAKEAYAIGKQLGDSVILMGTSTGGTLALMLAAEYPDIAGLILYSPNIAINDPNAWILNRHWGLQVARMVTKSDFITSKDQRPIYKQYWNAPYRLEAAVQLEELLETGIGKSNFQKVNQPTLLLYYYKDEVHQDSVVKVSAMQKMFRQLGTDSSHKKSVPLPETGDHVIGSYIKSNDMQSVKNETEKFLVSVMKMQKQL
ncbi:MAG: alpha/beta hydrolase [Bacteroidetes bacterium]|nr:MAG: alpha/beta hydrolase [Bacteroidota bacterium]